MTRDKLNTGTGGTGTSMDEVYRQIKLEYIKGVYDKIIIKIKELKK
jgi:hypothetical protein